jgi:hypothetical protein
MCHQIIKAPWEHRGGDMREQELKEEAEFSVQGRMRREKEDLCISAGWDTVSFLCSITESLGTMEAPLASQHTAPPDLASI